ncbi:MAG: multicopper oxidase domain-containing protein [Chloroflexi bacterium]|nr:multicopper oxidase domain-containing protein [Chloroflexota bacterium]
MALWLAVGLLLPGLPPAPGPAFAQEPPTETVVCNATVTANVVALDQRIDFNRLGAMNPVGMIYALKRDVVAKTGKVWGPGSVQLREDKRPRPLTLRVNVGDCLQVNFENLLDPMPLEKNGPIFGDQEQPATRAVGVHVAGMQLRNSISDDGSNVGVNPSSLVSPGGKATYTFYAEREGTYLLASPADNVSAESIGTQAFGLFGAVNVEPKGSEWYRSQVTRQEMDWATAGTTPTGQPVINYDALYPAGSGKSGPILNMRQGNEIVHSDLTAIITGPNKGFFAEGTYVPNPAYPNRNQPFREFTLIFHDENALIQAFPAFEDPTFEFGLHSVRDSFAINYGTGGIGAEILANRLGVGPIWDCVDCKYEEFFLTSWAVGDPAMVVDVPANTPGAGAKATRAFYPDDPSNVYHSYINDRTKFRNLSVGKEHHIFHLHAHQWLFTPDDDNSTYLDSQAIGPGSGYTYEIAYNGSGNRNKTVGDSIFHCHFYPHFAQGMWALWRSHDTFEIGTKIGADGRPEAGARALPDGEMPAGTPIPGVVPIPGLAMAPLPGGATVEPKDANGDGKMDSSQVKVLEPDKNPGYPFFIAGEAGHRPPTPPLDMPVDGGLPRHVIAGGAAASPALNPFDFSKVLTSAKAKFFPEAGTPAEQAAMAFHEQRWHASSKPDGAVASFETNGLPRQPGAPYAEPCRGDDGKAVGTPREWRGADIQLDMTIDKAGWHFPQARIIALWEDVMSTLKGDRSPEPFVMRANSDDCITYYLTNLVPSEYQQDAFQVKTPTDVLGQHIHLVKFDVTASDGSANGFNYEDGTMGPDEVRERIEAIHAPGGGCTGDLPADKTCGSLKPEKHPFFDAGPVPGSDRWLGARTTIQRWYADPLRNNLGIDRTIGTVYTHDHFSPSTHQQVGLYATLLIEPKDSQWRVYLGPTASNPNTTTALGGAGAPARFDGGPTSWRADILTADDRGMPTTNFDKLSFREFFLEYGDFQLAYDKNRGVKLGPDGKPILDPSTGQPIPIPDPIGAINPPGLKEVGLPDLMAKPDLCPDKSTPFSPQGCPEAISAADPGTFVVNYRNEPIALRVRDPGTNSQAADAAGDLSRAFASIGRADPDLNRAPNQWPVRPLTDDVRPGDPATPLLQAYENDRVRIRIQIGATEEGHNWSMHGVKWLQEFASPNSGWRNSQMLGISEQFILDVPVTPAGNAGAADYLYQASSSVDGLWNGNWGIMRAYPALRPGLPPLPSNPMGATGLAITNLNEFADICPTNASVRASNVTAVLAKDVLPGGTLVYNPRPTNGGPLHDPTAILYVNTEDLVTDANGKPIGLKPGTPVEPLILRASAGDCIKVTLQNKLPDIAPDLPGFNAMPPIVDGFNANDVIPSSRVGLHPQLVAYNVARSDGARVGTNGEQTVPPGGQRTYTWYAGDIKYDKLNKRLTATPMEFGATNLMSSDRIKHSNKGAIGALIIEPQGATWTLDAGTRASATIRKADGSSFREFVLLFQSDINLRMGDGTALPFVGGEEDAEDSGAKALNYKTEPLWFRLGITPKTTEGDLAKCDFKTVLANTVERCAPSVGPGGLDSIGDPVTPLFKAEAGQAVRFRVLDPGGHTRNHVFALHGHIWEREPYEAGSTRIGNNPFSQLVGTQEGHGPTNHWDIVPKHGAGGAFKVTGDYLYRDMAPGKFYQGVWGIFRVTPKPQ